MIFSETGVQQKEGTDRNVLRIFRASGGPTPGLSFSDILSASIPEKRHDQQIGS